MDVDFNLIELGFVLNLQTLRGVLKGLSVNGKRWWIACDPEDAVVGGFLTLGYGDPLCTDRLNNIAFHVPVIGSQNPRDKRRSLILLLDSATIVPDEPGYYIEDGRVKRDGMEDLFAFWQPIERALIARLNERNES